VVAGYVIKKYMLCGERLWERAPVTGAPASRTV